MDDINIMQSHTICLKTAVVILNYNTASLTEKLARKLSHFSSISHVVVIDNKSSDNSYQVLKQLEDSKIIVIDSGKNGGYSYGNNLGTRVCTDLGVDIVFISNPDVNVEEVDVEKILDGFEQSDYAMLSGIQYEIDGRVGKPEIWRKRNYIDDLADCFFITGFLCSRRRGIPVDYSKVIQPVDVLKGSFFAVRLRDFNDVNGYDEKVFLYSEERLLADKMQQMGKKIGIVTGARYDHMHSVSISKKYKNRTQRMKMLYHSRLYCNEKYENIRGIKKIFLKMCMSISLFEYSVIDLINSIRGN